MELKDKTILITGSTDGVGRVVAQRLGADGARILVHGRDATRGKATVAEIEAAGCKTELLVADLSSLAEVRRLAEAVRART
ncbi:MAG: SDR family NAD(P)-dependent oxidoreductase, partial [Mesorhizobium sp.]